jgi:ATP-dependent DNA helicase RecQ
VGIVTRYKEETEAAFMDAVKCEQWEVVVPRLYGVLNDGDVPLT